MRGDDRNNVAVRIAGLVHGFDDGTRLRVGDADITVHAGETVAIAGPNGCGKSTLLSHVLGLAMPTAGTVTTLGVPAHTLDAQARKRIVGVMQNPDDQLFGPTVRDDVSYGPRNWGFAVDEVDAMVDRSIARFGLSADADRIAHALSTGERRRVALAAAFVAWSTASPEGVGLVVLDEPFEGLDRIGAAALRDVLAEIRRCGRTATIFTTHDLEEVAALADRLIVMGPDGSVLASGVPLIVLSDRFVIQTANLRQPTMFRLRDALAAVGVEAPTTLNVETMANALRIVVTAQG